MHETKIIPNYSNMKIPPFDFCKSVRELALSRIIAVKSIRKEFSFLIAY
jgi:hypothetical protein